MNSCGTPKKKKKRRVAHLSRKIQQELLKRSHGSRTMSERGIMLKDVILDKCREIKE